MLISDWEETYQCEGMCYSPERVLSEIFALESAYENARAGISLSAIDQGFYLQEIARVISIIALQCRQQVYSYFLAIKSDLSAEKYKSMSNSKRIAALDDRYPTASMAIKSECGYELCEFPNANRIPFLLCIRKLCHVERWKFPVYFNFDEDTGNKLVEKYDMIDCALVVEIAETDSVIGLEKTKTIAIDIPSFATAARVLITECEDCNLPPVRDFHLDAELVCDTVN